jgi:hypothetical protein
MKTLTGRTREREEIYICSSRLGLIKMDHHHSSALWEERDRPRRVRHGSPLPTGHFQEQLGCMGAGVVHETTAAGAPGLYDFLHDNAPSNPDLSVEFG